MEPRYLSPFDIATDDCSRQAKMLRRVEAPVRARLEAARATLRVARWVAGGSLPADRSRRADVALYLRARYPAGGWPDLWVLEHYRQADRLANAERRNRGLRQLDVEDTCRDVERPAQAPAPKRERAGASSFVGRLRLMNALVDGLTEGCGLDELRALVLGQKPRA